MTAFRVTRYPQSDGFTDWAGRPTHVFHIEADSAYAAARAAQAQAMGEGTTRGQLRRVTGGAAAEGAARYTAHEVRNRALLPAELAGYEVKPR